MVTSAARECFTTRATYPALYCCAPRTDPCPPLRAAQRLTCAHTVAAASRDVQICADGGFAALPPARRGSSAGTHGARGRRGNRPRVGQMSTRPMWTFLRAPYRCRRRAAARETSRVRSARAPPPRGAVHRSAGRCAPAIFGRKVSLFVTATRRRFQRRSETSGRCAGQGICPAR